MICIGLFLVNSGTSFAIWLSDNSYSKEGSSSPFLSLFLGKAMIILDEFFTQEQRLQEIQTQYERVLKDPVLIAVVLNFKGRFSIKSLFIFLKQCKQLSFFTSGDTILPPQRPSLISNGFVLDGKLETVFRTKPINYVLSHLH